MDQMEAQSMLDGLKQRARRLKTELYALYLAYRDPRVPWYARVFAAGVVAYAVGEFAQRERASHGT